MKEEEEPPQNEYKGEIREVAGQNYRVADYFEKSCRPLLTTEILGATIDETLFTSIETFIELYNCNCEPIDNEPDETSFYSAYEIAEDNNPSNNSISSKSFIEPLQPTPPSTPRNSMHPEPPPKKRSSIPIRKEPNVKPNIKPKDPKNLIPTPKTSIHIEDKKVQTSFESITSLVVSNKDVQTLQPKLTTAMVQTSFTFLPEVKSTVMSLPDEQKLPVKSIPTQTDITLPMNLMVDLRDNGCSNFTVTCHDRQHQDKSDLDFLRNLGIDDSKRVAKINIGPLCLCHDSDKSSGGESGECSCGSVQYRIGSKCRCTSTSSSNQKIKEPFHDDLKHQTASPALIETGDEIPKDVRYAVTRISRYKDFTTYEVMKSTKNQPKVIPKLMEGIFVLRKRSHINSK